MLTVKRFKPPRVRHYQERPTAVYDSLPGARECRRKFLHFFPNGFFDESYIKQERNHKWLAHKAWQLSLHYDQFTQLVLAERFEEISRLAIKIEAGTKLLHSSERTALREVVKHQSFAQLFAVELFNFLHGAEDDDMRFERWCEAVNEIPRKQTRILTWRVITVFGFIAEPWNHIFLQPNVTRTAAREYGYDFTYQPHPSWITYQSLQEFAAIIRKDLRDLQPRDLIDIQSYMRVQGSPDYNE
jgi:hypothetical protein